MQLFAAHPGEVFSRDRLLNEVWGYNYYGTTRTLDQVIVQLRKKLGDSGDAPQLPPHRPRRRLQAEYDNLTHRAGPKPGGCRIWYPPPTLN